MVIDCDTCVVRGLACGDCVISVLLGLPTPLGDAAMPAPARAGSTVPDAGTVPRLQLVRQAG